MTAVLPLLAIAKSRWREVALSLEPRSRERNQPTHLVRFALRMFMRDLRSGRLLLMLLATVIAVASSVSVNLLVNRVNRAMTAESSALLAADLTIVTRAPPAQRLLQHAQDNALVVGRTITLRSVVAADEQLQLVRLKAVDDHYPLRGRVQISDGPSQAVRHIASGPGRGEVWADLRLFQLLDLKPGDTLEIGRSALILRNLLVLEPDRGGDLFSFAPRVLMHTDDLAASGLIIPGSRATYTLLLAGSVPDIDQFRSTLELLPGETLVDPRAARPEIQNAFGQADRFLSLAAFVGVLLATVGIALSAAAYSDHHANTVAIFKTLGLTSANVAVVLSVEILLLAALAAIIGDGLALGVHQVLLAYYLPDVNVSAIGVGLAPLLYGLWIASVVLAGFALPALLRLTRIPVNAVLMRDRSGFGLPGWAPFAMMVVAVICIAPWHLNNPTLIALALAGMLGSALALAIAAYALVHALGKLRARTAIGWRFGLANIARRAHLSVLQCTAIGLGISVILLLAVVRDDLLGQWRGRVPLGAPNHFLINVQGDEVDAMRDFLATHKREETLFYPMVRGRLSQHNGEHIDANSYTEPRAQRLADRDFNLSWASQLKADNRLSAGKWWLSSDSAQLSVEEGLAKTLNIRLGDSLRFSVADGEIEGRVTNLRHVDWDNFEVNFFVVTSPELLRDAPATYITSFFLDASARTLMPELVKRFPSVTVIDVEALLRQVRQVMDRVAGALTWVFAFAVMAGILVLAAAVQASQRERLIDVVLLKTLGASRRFIRTTLVIEFVVLGALAGVLGSAGAATTGWLLAHFVLEIPYSPDWRIALTGIACGVGGVTILGMVVAYFAQRRSVVAGLRAVL